MRRIVLLSLFALLLSPAYAQRRGGFRPSFARSPFVSPRIRSPFRSALGYGYASTSGYVPYDTLPYAYSPQPVVFVEPPDPVEPPPPPAHAVITDYKIPDAVPTPSSEPQTFTIVLKNGSTLAATAIIASDDGLHFVDPDDRHLRVSMAAVDRAATQKLNRERNLSLYLPAPQ